jgi:hypothetical protein
MATTTKPNATVTPINSKAKASPATTKDAEPEIEEYHGPNMISTPKLIGAFLLMCLVLWLVYSMIGAPHVDGNGVLGALLGFVIVAAICYVVSLVAEHLLHLHHRSILAGLGHLTAGILKLAGTNGEKFLSWSYVKLGQLLGPNWTRFCGAVSTLFRGKSAEDDEDGADPDPLDPNDRQYIGTEAGMERLRRAIISSWCDGHPAELEHLVRTATGQFTAYVCDEVMRMVGKVTDDAEKALSIAYGSQVWIGGFTSPNGVELRVFALPEDDTEEDTTDPADVSAPAETSAGETPAESRKDLPVTTTTTDMEPRRAGGRMGGRVPPAGRAMINMIDDFTPTTDDELHEKILGVAAFLHDLGVAMQEMHGRCLASDVRLGKGAMQATHDAADAVVDAGAGATKASEDFATYYANVSDEVAGGKTLPKDGDFITGNNA